MSAEVESLIAQSVQHYKNEEHEESLAAASRARELSLSLGDTSQAHRDALINVSVRARSKVGMLFACVCAGLAQTACMLPVKGLGWMPPL